MEWIIGLLVVIVLQLFGVKHALNKQIVHQHGAFKIILEQFEKLQEVVERTIPLKP